MTLYIEICGIKSYTPNYKLAQSIKDLAALCPKDSVQMPLQHQ